jgi:SAM-dependent methyltransferase
MLATTLRRTLARHPALKAVARQLLRPFRGGTSTDYRKLADADRASTITELKGAWQHDDIPRLQRVGVEQSLAAYRAGAAMPPFDVFVELLRPLAAAVPGQTLLEIGCSSGYYAEVLALRGLDLRYSGCDFSSAFIDLARQCHPAQHFDVADATALPYADDAFDIVVSGCCLLHIPDYRSAIAETARVARRHALFHRTLVVHTLPTQYFTKLAYGVKTVEIHFSESELVALFAVNGLRVVAVETLSADWRQGDAFAMKSYLCEKKSP